MLTFDFIIAGHDDNYMITNLGRYISSRDVIKIGGDTIYDLCHCYLYYTYKDLWLTTKQRENKIFRGIHKTKKLSKPRSGQLKKKTQLALQMLIRKQSQQANGKRDFELFPNPGILSVDIAIEDIFNKVYTQSLKPITNGLR